MSTHTLCEELQISLNTKISDEDCTLAVNALLGDIRLGRRQPDLDLHNLTGLQISYPGTQSQYSNAVLADATDGSSQGLSLKSRSYPRSQMFVPQLLPQPELILEFNSNLPTVCISCRLMTLCVSNQSLVCIYSVQRSSVEFPSVSCMLSFALRASRTRLWLSHTRIQNVTRVLVTLYCIEYSPKINPEKLFFRMVIIRGLQVFVSLLQVI